MSRSLFSLTVEESKYFNDNQPKIEVFNCTQNKEACVEKLALINQYFLDSRRFHLDKDYQRSIEALKKAFQTTFEIQEPSCLPHAEMFRSTIISSIENIHSDLKQMTTGWFKSKRFQSSLEFATMALEECRMNQ